MVVDKGFYSSGRLTLNSVYLITQQPKLFVLHTTLILLYSTFKINKYTQAESHREACILSIKRQNEFLFQACITAFEKYKQNCR